MDETADRSGGAVCALGAPESDGLRLLRAGEAARQAGVGIQTLHYYEREGLIAAPPRSPSGYREYDAAQVDRVRAIKRTQALGFSLSEIRELIAIADGTLDAARLPAVVRARMQAIEERIEELTRMKGALERAAADCLCEGEPTRCDVLNALVARGEPARAEP